MNSVRYILKGHTPTPEPNLYKWADWYEKADRRVAQYKMGEVRVSTVFLGLNYNFGEGKPILFETMVFGGKYDGFQDRYETWEESEKGHRATVKMVKKSLDKNAP